MSYAARKWWGRLQALAPWLVLEPLLPGATLFALLLWLTQLYLREGFDHVRQYALAPAVGHWVAAAPVKRNWSNCPCASLAACACLSAIARGLRSCCALVPGRSRAAA